MTAPAIASPKPDGQIGIGTVLAVMIRLAGERPLATTYSESDKPYSTKKKRAGVPVGDI
jgi:hypothetical protein